MSKKTPMEGNEYIIPIEEADFILLERNRKDLIDCLNNSGGSAFYARSDIRKIKVYLDQIAENLTYIDTTAKIPTKNGPEPDKQMILKAFKLAFNF